MQKCKEKVIEFLKEPILYLIIGIILVQCWIYSSVPKSNETGDSFGYLTSYNQDSIFHGYVNDERPPVYPYFIKVIKVIGGEENLENNVVTVQKILFLVSIVIFYYTLKLLLKNKIIISILTLIFGICPTIIMWNTYIVTESLAGLEMMILAFITIKYLKEPSKILAGLMGIVILGMILTKPAFIYVLPIYIVFVILRFFFNKEERKALLFAVGSLIICGVVLITYCMQIKKYYGNFGLTAISCINNTILAIDSGAYLNSDNQEIKNEIKTFVEENNARGNDLYSIVYELKEKYSQEKMNEFASSAIKNTSDYNIYLINKVINLGNQNIGTSYVNGDKSDQEYIYNYSYLGGLILPITFGMIYILLLISIIYLIWYLIKYKEIDWLCAFFTSMIFTNLFTLVVGAPYEEQRLFFPSVCLVLIYIANILGRILIGKENLLNEKIVGGE